VNHTARISPLAAITLVLLMVFHSSTLYSQSSVAVKLAAYIDELQRDKDLLGASLSFKVVDLASGAKIASYRSDTRLIPASIQKLLTTGAGFIVLGKQHTFNTLLASSGTVSDSVFTGKIYLVGGGDPCFGSESFERTVPDSVFTRFAHALKRKGINKIHGKIIPVAAGLASERAHPSWEWEDIGAYYGAGVSSLNFCENSFDITLKASDMLPENLSISGNFPFDLSLTSSLIPVHRDSSCTAAVYSSPTCSTVYYLEGEVPSSGKEYKLSAALRNPEAESAFCFARFLENHGFSGGFTASEPIFVEPKEQLTEIFTEISPEYSDIALKTNVYSNNIYADAIFKAVSKSLTGESTYEKSARALASVFKSLGLDVDKIRITDGSGLSRRNLMTADFMCDYLRAITQVIPDFENYIPYPGGEGTLKNFMLGHRARSRIRLKSGSMNGVLNYAGYIKNKQGKTLCFTVMVNNFTCKTAVIRKKIEQIVEIVAENSLSN
jgi:D-alanyl-D-alanine carboxypeptidase/D-alanyl-D-alanine-endopeptidase (penicillin-binding protein 4)